MPSAAELPERIGGVLDVVHLLFTTGHTAPAGDTLTRIDLAERALDLVRILHALHGRAACDEKRRQRARKFDRMRISH